MRLKDRSLLIQKNIAVLLHLIFLVLAVSGISFIYLNTESGLGISWLRDRKYEDSPQFMEQFQQDLNQLFQYISYRDAFENDGILDLSSFLYMTMQPQQKITESTGGHTQQKNNYPDLGTPIHPFWNYHGKFWTALVFIIKSIIR